MILQDKTGLHRLIEKEEVDLEEIRDCCYCRKCIQKGRDKYTCKPMQQKKHFFCSDSTDTAEDCKYFEYTKVSR